MSKSEIYNARVLIDYVPAQLTEGESNWEIYYYAKNPDTGKLKRIRIRVNRIKSLTERRKYCKKLMQEINVKLHSGWNPFIEKEAPKAYYNLFDVLDTYFNLKVKEGKDNSIRSYRSYIKMFKDYLKGIEKSDIYVSNFSKTDARDFLNEMYLTKNLTPRTFNNYLLFFRTFSNWMIEYSYVSVNVFQDIKKKKEGHKTRVQFIEEKYRRLIVNELEQRSDNYLLAVELAYHCLIRPGEMMHLRIGDINLNEQTICLSGSFTKNGKTRYATIPNVLIAEVEKLYNLYPNNRGLYIFSTGYVPGRVKVDSRNISKRWDRLRTALALPKEMQFYSLRDTGIIQKLKDGISPDEVMYQADHSSLEVTNKYVKIANPRVYENVKSKATSF